MNALADTEELRVPDVGGRRARLLRVVRDDGDGVALRGRAAVGKVPKGAALEVEVSRDCDNRFVVIPRGRRRVRVAVVVVVVLVVTRAVGVLDEAVPQYAVRRLNVLDLFPGLAGKVTSEMDRRIRGAVGEQLPVHQQGRVGVQHDLGSRVNRQHDAIGHHHGALQ